MKNRLFLLVLTVIILLATAGASSAADKVIASKTQYFPIETVVEKKIDLSDFELFSWEAVKVTRRSGQNPWEPLEPGVVDFPPGRGTFTQNWSDGSKTTGTINFNKNGTFTQTGTGGNVPFTSRGNWTYNANINFLTIVYTSYVLKGVTITPGAGDTWNTLSGTLTNGSGKLRDADNSWSVDVSG